MQINLQQAVEILDTGDLPYSQANAAKVRGSARKCARLPGYNCDISRIPVDPGAFADRWSRNMQNKDAPEGFKTFKQFSNWHSNVKSLMDHVSGKRREQDLLRQVEDNWSLLLGTVESLIRVGRKGIGVQQEDLISLKVLRNVARENGRQPKQLTAGLLQNWMKSASTGQRNAMRRALATLNGLHSISHDLLAELLPPPIDDIPMVTVRRVTPSLPPRLAQAIADMEKDLRQGQPYDGLLSRMKKPPCREGTVKNAREAARWFYSCMVELDFLSLDDNPAPAKFATVDYVLAAFEAEVAGDYHWQPLGKRTLRKNLEGTFRFLRRFNPDLKLVQAEFFKGAYFQKWEKMTEENQAFCRRLVKSDRRKVKFFNLAWEFHAKAVPLIANYEDLTDNQQAQAANWALAAAAAAILTFLPVRADTLIQLTVEGPEAHVILPHRSKNVNLAIPPELIKNKNKLVTDFARRGKTDPRAVLEWWLKDARPIMMARLKCPDEALLLGGAGYANLNKAWRFATASVDFYMNLHQVRHAIASILWNEPGSDINVIAALLGDLPETVATIYAFHDREADTERGMKGMADINAKLSKGLRR
jgi:hypothetical protein